MQIQAFNTNHQFLANGKWWAYAIERLSVVGCVSLEDRGNEWAWLNDLFVAVEFRRMGFASHLVEFAIRQAPAAIAAGRDTQGVACGVDPKNTASISLFEELGFRWVLTYPDSPTRLYSLRITDK